MTIKLVCPHCGKLEIVAQELATEFPDLSCSKCLTTLKEETDGD